MEKNKPVPVENQNIVYYQEDEIDLYELYLILKKRWKSVFLTFLLFLLIAIGYILTAKPVYSTEFYIKIPSVYVKEGNSLKKENILTVEETSSLIKKLQDKLKEENYSDLSKALNLSESKIKKIKDINPEKLRNNKEIIKIRIETNQSNLIPVISSKILDYLNNYPYIKEKLKLEKEKLAQLINISQSELENMKKTKDLILKNIQEGKIRNFSFNPADIDAKILEISQRITQLQLKLQELKGFELSVSPTIPKKPSKPKKALIIAVASVSGLFLGIFFAFFKEWIENARKRHEENIG
ncbi:Wzz/FepE/Etk N-terminal domain-containing protein [Persephonella sp. KM09-Lau-8]|uniref:Wzz/FepE/Etk N-terminal domain-containing protein n=1 Tax=Persephonella sp. KM09-Lau-8 TaxID=1158345 RepID=UPI000496C1D7|nr:Wzz/FepE/Etk N-terminal domain-containing protein [Persephonella sp. KM09-Lau-8]